MATKTRRNAGPACWSQNLLAAKAKASEDKVVRDCCLTLAAGPSPAYGPARRALQARLFALGVRVPNEAYWGFMVASLVSDIR